MQGKDSEKPTGLLKGKPTGLCIPLYRICALSYELCTSQCNTNAVLCEKKSPTIAQFFMILSCCFFYLFHSCHGSWQSHQRETGRLFTVTYIKVEKWAFQSQCVREGGGRSGCKKRPKLQRRGLMVLGGVIWSRLKPEQEGLVTEAYLWRRHWGSETVALWENLLQQTCREGDMGRSLKGRRDEGTRGGKLRAGHREG